MTDAEQPPTSPGEEPGDLPEEGTEAHADFIAAERAHRLQKLDRLRDRGIEPYPVKFDRDHRLGEIREQFGDLEPGEETDTEVRVAGRVMLIRRHGKLVFADLDDHSGRVQLMAAVDDLDERAFDEFSHLDRGD